MPNLLQVAIFPLQFWTGLLLWKLTPRFLEGEALEFRRNPPFLILSFKTRVLKDNPPIIRRAQSHRCCAPPRTIQLAGEALCPDRGPQKAAPPPLGAPRRPLRSSPVDASALVPCSLIDRVQQMAQRAVELRCHAERRGQRNDPATRPRIFRRIIRTKTARSKVHLCYYQISKLQLLRLHSVDRIFKFRIGNSCL